MLRIRTPFLLSVLALAGAGAPLHAADTGATTGELQAMASHSAGGTDYAFRVSGASGEVFALMAELSAPWQPGPGTPLVLGLGRLDAEGAGELHLGVAPAAAEGMPPTLAEFTALHVHDGALVETAPGQLLLGEVPSEILSFNFAPGGEPLEAGEIVDGQFSSIGITLSAESARPGGTDTLAVFDSANPTGGDQDLMTPGPGVGNDEPLGNLLILADDTTDADMDGLIDDPGDDQGGGTISFGFDEPTTVTGLKVVDVDDPGGATVEFFDGDDELLGFIDIPNLGDNAVQDLDIMVEQVRRMDIVLASSGGIATLSFLGCPSAIDFDATVTGIPLDLSEGELLANQFDALGVNFSGQSFATGMPTIPVLFDSGDPTGGDFDLAAPGPHPTNEAPQGLVVIVPENTLDADDDGLVDEPDDESFGGVIAIDFDFPVEFRGIGVLDVDEDEDSFVRFFDSGGELITLIPLIPIGNNSFQNIELEIPFVSRVEVVLGGSGAITGLRYCPIFDVEL